MLILIANCHGRMIHFPLQEQSTEIIAGSLPENHIYLPYKGVSRRHFSLARNKDQWLLRDLGSTNGTRHNGRIIKETVVQPEDKIQAGIVEFQLKRSDADAMVGLEEIVNSETPNTRTDPLVQFGRLTNANIFSFSKLRFPPGMVAGKSPRMIEIYQKLHSLVDSDVNILLIGETGTGKEMIAQMLQLSGKRSQGPFIIVNCAAIPSNLVESELFGIGEKVATDVSSRKGKLVLADKGTLFLDELSAFPMSMQPKILRAIEEKLIFPVGESRPIPVDFRLICATNQSPSELIKAGMLREDLYHRVATVEIHVPPLRERQEDIGLMAIGLLQVICKRENKSIAGISKKLLSLLAGYSYPGNVRELLNLLRSMVALAHPGEVLDVHLAPGKLLESRAESGESDPADAGRDPDGLRESVDKMTRRLILQSLVENQYNLAKVAKQLKVSTFGLRKMMRRLDISSKKAR